MKRIRKNEKRDEAEKQQASSSSPSEIPIAEPQTAVPEEKVSIMMKYGVTLAHDMADRAKYIEMGRGGNAISIFPISNVSDSHNVIVAQNAAQFTLSPKG